MQMTNNKYTSKICYMSFIMTFFFLRWYVFINPRQLCVEICVLHQHQIFTMPSAEGIWPQVFYSVPSQDGGSATASHCVLVEGLQLLLSPYPHPAGSSLCSKDIVCTAALLARCVTPLNYADWDWELPQSPDLAFSCPSDWLLNKIDCGTTTLIQKMK